MMKLAFLPYPFLAGLIILAFLLNSLRRKHSRTYLFFFSLFWVYMLLVAGVTIFPILTPGAGHARAPLSRILGDINLVPFNFLQMYHNKNLVLFVEVVGNILMTIPYGFGLPFLKHIQPKRFIWLAMAIGFTIETLQLIEALMTGLIYRQVDINDFLLNTTGALIGYGLFQAFAWLYLAVYKNTEVKKKGLFAYVLKVTDRQEWVNEHLS